LLLPTGKELKRDWKQKSSLTSDMVFMKPLTYFLFSNHYKKVALNLTFNQNWIYHRRVDSF